MKQMLHTALKTTEEDKEDTQEATLSLADAKEISRDGAVLSELDGIFLHFKKLREKQH